MTDFLSLHKISSFRRAFETLLDLDDDERQVLAAAIATSDGRPEDAPEPGRKGLSLPYSALLTLRTIVGEAGLDEVLADVRSTYRDDTRIDAVVGMMEPTLREIEESFLRDVEYSTLPILINGKLSLDYRVVERDSGEVALVPLFVARLDFDEHVGGSDAATFQIPPDRLVEIRDKISAALTLLAKSNASVGPKHISDVAIAKQEKWQS